MHKNLIACQLIALLLSAFWLTGCGSESAPETTETVLRPVKTLRVSASKNQNIRQLPGVVDAVRKAELAFRVSGVVKKLLVNEGEEVKKGQLLAELDQADFAIALSKDKANFNSAESAFKRGRSLVDKGHISKADFETLKASYSTAKAQFSASKQNIKYTRLLAPFAGVVAKHHVERFEEVSNRQTIISIQDLSRLVVSIDVPESLMIAVKGDEEKPYTSYATFDAIEGEQFPLTFKEAATQADKATKTFKVALTMSNTTGYSILPGMTSTVHARRNIDNDAPGVFYLPSHAVLEDEQGRFVYTAQPQVTQNQATQNQADNALGIVQRTNITVGKITSQGIIVDTGLQDGDYVIVAGMSKIHAGLKVRLETRE